MRAEHASAGGGIGRLEGFECLERVGVDGRDDGEVVLKLEEVVVLRRREGNGVVKRVVHGGEVRTKGHLADDMGEVEC